MAVTSRWSRRTFLRRLAGSGALLLVPGCGYYAPEGGDAYAPWRFPEGSEGDLRLVHAAVLASSPHNTQPWHFTVKPGEVGVFVDEARSLGAMDAFGRERAIGVGCALENLVIAARQYGRNPVVTDAAVVDMPQRLALVTLTDGAVQEQPLFSALAGRRTNRGRYAGFSLDARIPGQLAELIADEPRVGLHVLTDAEQMSTFGAATVEATEAIIADTEMLEDSDAWYRHSYEDIDTNRDGVTLDAQALSHLVVVLGKSSGRPSAKDGASFWLSNTRDVHTKGNSAYLLLSCASLTEPADLVAVGRAYQRIHLWLTLNGLAAQPLNQLAERRDRELQLGLEPVFGDVLSGFVPAGRYPQMLFRVGYPFEHPHHSPRRAVADVAEVSS